MASSCAGLPYPAAILAKNGNIPHVEDAALPPLGLRTGWSCRRRQRRSAANRALSANPRTSTGHAPGVPDFPSRSEQSSEGSFSNARSPPEPGSAQAWSSFGVFATQLPTQETPSEPRPDPQSRASATPLAPGGGTPGEQREPLRFPGDFFPSGAGQVEAGRRLLLSGAGATALALGANFLGVTSGLLNLSPGTARDLRLDVLYPVGGFKRCYELSRGFEFVYPTAWLGDQRLVYRAAQRDERRRALDPQPLSGGGRGAAVEDISSDSGGTGADARPVEPLVAFGPPGGTGELNISVIVAHVDWGFRLERFGGAEDVGKRLLANVIAPPGSRLEASLLAASQRQLDGALYYTLEFTVVGPTFRRHNLSVFCVRNSELYSLTAQAPEAEWGAVAGSFRTAADSFRVLPS